MPQGVPPTITLTEDDGWWIAKDTETGVTSQGRSETDALDNLNEALDAYHGEGEEPTDEELREMGVDPDENEPGSPDDHPIFE